MYRRPVVEDARGSTETLLNNRNVVGNVEGLDVEKTAQELYYRFYIGFLLCNQR